jgi:hypothetical protein
MLFVVHNALSILYVELFIFNLLSSDLVSVDPQRAYILPPLANDEKNYVNLKSSTRWSAIPVDGIKVILYQKYNDEVNVDGHGTDIFSQRRVPRSSQRALWRHPIDNGEKRHQQQTQQEHLYHILPVNRTGAFPMLSPFASHNLQNANISHAIGYLMSYNKLYKHDCKQVANHQNKAHCAILSTAKKSYC